MSNSINNSGSFGFQDSSYRRVGEETGLRKLSTDFYNLMDSLPEAEKIRKMYKEDLTVMTDKLTIFLSMWPEGPPHYIEKYGETNIPRAHMHLISNESERDAWLLSLSPLIQSQQIFFSISEIKICKSKGLEKTYSTSFNAFINNQSALARSKEAKKNAGMGFSVLT